MANEQVIWDEMLKFIENPFGVAGLMGNLKAESGLKPDILETKYRKSLGMTSYQYIMAVDNGTYTDFVDDGAGFGLAQWTYSEHKKNLLTYARYKGVSIGDLQMQIEFLQSDLNAFSSVLNVLKTATSVREASDDVLLRYEKPADTGESVKKKRAEYGQAFYDKYADKTWEKNHAKANAVVALARSRIGDPYVFGALGETCTVANRNKYSDNDNCPRIHDGKKTCTGCKYKGGHIYDCRGFTYAMLKEAAKILISTVGATTQYDTKSDWMEQGKTADGLPDIPCCLFKYKGGRMSHTGLHIGGGNIIHCSGEVKTGVIDTSWTHYGVPIGLYTKEYLSTVRRIKNVGTMKKGSKGAAVKTLQEDLAKLGYDCGTIDGTYGTKTVAAVKQFQADYNLSVDGIAGIMTLNALADALAKKEEPKTKTKTLAELTADYISLEKRVAALEKKVK